MTSTDASDENLAEDLMAHPAAVLGPLTRRAAKFLGKTLADRERTELLEALLRETMFRSVRDELLDNPHYGLTPESASSDEGAIRSAVTPVVRAAIRCAINNPVNRRTRDLGTLSEISAREKIKGWLIGGVNAVYKNGRLSAEAGAPPAGLDSDQRWGSWWDALADTGYPVVTRAVDQFRNVVQDAADDPNGSDKSCRFAQRLDAELAANDIRREKRRRAAWTAAAGTVITGGLAAGEAIAAVHALLPATLGAAGLSAALVGWFVAQAHAAPTAAQVTELSLAIESVREWTVNVEQSHVGDEQRLLDVLQRRLLPSLEPFSDAERIRLLRATLSRAGGLLEDREARAPSYKLASLESAMRQLHEMIDAQPPPDDR